MPYQTVSSLVYEELKQVGPGGTVGRYYFLQKYRNNKKAVSGITNQLKNNKCISLDEDKKNYHILPQLLVWGGNRTWKTSNTPVIFPDADKPVPAKVRPAVRIVPKQHAMIPAVETDVLDALLTAMAAAADEIKRLRDIEAEYLEAKKRFSA